MNGGSATDALDRIQSAVARIEKLAAELPSGSELVRRHARLRTAVQQSLAELDALIEAREEGIEAPPRIETEALIEAPVGGTVE